MSLNELRATTLTGALHAAPDLGFEHEPWTVDALCAQVDHDLFFPEKGGSTREAKTVCANCPVVEDCLDYALRTGERFGIYGGKSERERRAIAKERAA